MEGLPDEGDRHPLLHETLETCLTQFIGVLGPCSFGCRRGLARPYRDSVE